MINTVYFLEPSNNSFHGGKHGSKDPREHRDPRRTSTGSAQPGLPTPSPSQYSPSLDSSTPPTPLISAMNRHHPVADLKTTSYMRRVNSLDSDYLAAGSPASICSASFNSGSFEPISPPPVSRLRLASLENSTLPPPPPPGPLTDKPRVSSKPPPPPPVKQEIYEDISPTAVFDEDRSSPGIDTRAEKTNETFVQAHLLGLRIVSKVNETPESRSNECTTKRVENRRSPCTASPSRVIEGSKKLDSGSYKDRRDHRSPTVEDYRYKNSGKRDEKRSSYDRTENRSDRRTSSPYQTHTSRGSSPHQKIMSVHARQKSDREHSRSPFHRESPERRSPLTKPDFLLLDKKPPIVVPQTKNFIAEPTLDSSMNNSVYEAISDSDDDMKCSSNDIRTGGNKNLQIEDISPASSPVRKKAINGLATCISQSETRAENLVGSEPKVGTGSEQVEMDIDKDDDDDDAMSLSSISSNEDTALVLNTPVTRLPVQVPCGSSHNVAAYQQMAYSTPVQFMPQRPQVPPPVNVAIPPPVNVAAPPPVSLAPRPAVNLQQTRILPHLPPPPHVNIRVPPPGIPFNKHLPPPFPNRPSQRPPMQPSQPPLATYPPRPGAGGFIGSFSRPYSGFFPGDYPKYPKYNQTRDRPVIEARKEVPYKTKVKNSCATRTKKDLKSVLHRDLIKRLVEHSGFAAFEAWWDNQTKSKVSVAEF